MLLRRWVVLSDVSSRLGAPKDDARFLRNVRNCWRRGAASQLTRPVPWSLDAEWARVGGQCRHSTVCGVAVSGKRRLPSSRWLPNLPNLRKSVFVLGKSV